MILALLALYACGGKKETVIKGGGATFPYPYYSQIFDLYHKKTQVKVNYQSIGSGGGVKQITEKTLDFGASDKFINDKELSEINTKTENRLLHVPIVMGGVTITYNLEEVSDLNLDGDTLAAIFMGKIKNWDNKAIVALNPGRALPAKEIIVVRRSDGSGTTAALSSFLADVNADWKKTMGVGKSLNWFDGSIGAKGNEGVTGQLLSIPSSFSYVSLNYAQENNLPTVAVKNAFGNFIKPSVATVTLAANTDIPADTRIDLTVLKGDSQGYPISTFTWLLFYQEQNYDRRSREDAEALKTLLSWMISPEAQDEATALYYSPLSQKAVERAQAVIDSMTYDGSSL